MPYEIKFAADVRQHLEALTARERSTALEVIEDSFCTNHWSRRGIENLCVRTPSPLGSYESETFGHSMKSFLATLTWSASWPWGKRKEMLFE